MPDPVQEYLAKYGPQEDPVASYLAKYSPEPEEPSEPEGRVKPGVRILQGLLGMSQLLVGKGEEPRRRIGPGGPEEGTRPAWASVPGEKVAEALETLEERHPRPEHVPLETGSAGELIGSVGKNVPALTAEMIEMLPALVAAEGGLGAMGMTRQLPKAKGFLDIMGGLSRSSQRAARGGKLGGAFSVLSGEDDPTKILQDAAAFAALEMGGGAFIDLIKVPGAAKKLLREAEVAPRSPLSPRAVEGDALLGSEVADILAIRSAEPGSGVAGQAARPRLSPELTAKGNVRQILKGTDRADLKAAGTELASKLEGETHAAQLASELERFAQRAGRGVETPPAPQIGVTPKPTPAQNLLRPEEVAEMVVMPDRAFGREVFETLGKPKAREVFNTTNEALERLNAVYKELSTLTSKDLASVDPTGGLNISSASPRLTNLLAERDAVLRSIHNARNKGFISNRALFAMGRAGVGGAVGGTMGETPEERAMNAFGLAALGVAGPSLARRLIPKGKSKLPEHSRAIQERIHWSPDEPKTDWANLGSEVWGGLWEGTAPLKRFGSKTLNEAEQAYVWARALQTSKRRSLGFMQAGPGRYNAQGTIEPTGTKGMTQIARDIGNDFDALDRYRVAVRVLEDLQGKKTGFNDLVPQMQREVAEALPNIRQAQRDIVRFEEDIIQYMTDAGLVGEAERLAMKAANPNHATFLRLIDKMKLPAGERAKLLKEYVGGEQPILSPWLSTISQTSRMVRAADLNRVRQGILKAVEEAPEAMADIARLAPTKETAKQVTNLAKEYQIHAAERGIQMTPEAAQFILDKSGESYFKSSLEDGVLTVYRGGKPIRLTVDEQTVKALGSLEPYELAPYMRWLGDLKGLLTAGITGVPEFFTRNFWRDASQAAVQTQYGGASKWIPFRRGVGGLKESVKANWGKTPSEVYNTVVRGGLGFNIARGGGIESVHAMNREIARPLTKVESVVRTVKHPWEALQMMGRPFEEANRIPEYMASRKAGESDLRAVMASQDISVNFQETGYWPAIRALQMMIPFMGPTLQGGRIVTKLLRENPKRTLGTALVTSAIPATMLWFANHKDTEIQEMRRRSGGHNWFYIRTPSTTPGAVGEIIKVPKDFTYQRVMSTFVEAVLDMAYLKDPDAIEDWAITGMREFGTSTLPVPLNVAHGVVSGKDPYFQTPLEDPATQNLPPYMRGTDYTGPIAKATAAGASRALDVLPEGTPFVEGAREAMTPGNIEYMARGFGGTMGAGALNMADAIVDLVSSGDGEKVSPPARELADNPLTLGFVARRATTAVKPVQDFYDTYNRVKEIQAGIDADEKSDVPSRVARAERVRGRNAEDLSLLGTMEFYHKAMKRERDAIDDILNTPDNIMDRERKAEERMFHIQEIRSLAREAQAELRAIKKDTK